MEDSFGECLKQARLQKGLSLATIAQVTRILPDHLQALERNDLAHLPPAPLYAKAFLKAYVRCLALSEVEETEMLRLFMKSATTFYATRTP